MIEAPATAREEIAINGFAIIRGVLQEEECAEIIRTVGPVSGAGERGLLAHPAVVQLADSDRLKALLRPHLAIEPLPVRAIYFDKTQDTNWPVAWHQDMTIALRERHEIPGWGQWSVKGGNQHAQPPVTLLEKMITVRLHLDPCDETNGALSVLAGSHRHGRFSPDDIRIFRNDLPATLCRADAGDVLLMRPLLLHASRRSQSDRHRRVLHIEYAGFELPEPLAWNKAA